MPVDKTLGFSVRFSEVHIFSTGEGITSSIQHGRNASDVLSGIPEGAPKLQLQANSGSGHSKVSATMMSGIAR